MSDKYEGVTHVVHVSTDSGTGCEECSEFVVGIDRFAESVNHYIEVHGYCLLHVGSEWAGEASDGAPINATVAVLGR